MASLTALRKLGGGGRSTPEASGCPYLTKMLEGSDKIAVARSFYTGVGFPLTQGGMRRGKMVS